MFIDSDIQFRAEDVISMLDKDLPFIGGVYSRKRDCWDKDVGALNMTYVVCPPENGPPFKVNEPYEVIYIGTGMMLLKREVLETMMKSYPGETYLLNEERHYKFFDCELSNHVYLSEDYYFCKRWRMLGGKIYAAYWVKTTHWGINAFHAHPLTISDS
jgi:hypothetical protein